MTIADILLTIYREGKTIIWTDIVQKKYDHVYQKIIFRFTVLSVMTYMLMDRRT